MVSRGDQRTDGAGGQSRPMVGIGGQGQRAHGWQAGVWEQRRLDESLGERLVVGRHVGRQRLRSRRRRNELVGGWCDPRL